MLWVSIGRGDSSSVWWRPLRMTSRFVRWFFFLIVAHIVLALIVDRKRLYNFNALCYSVSRCYGCQSGEVTRHPTGGAPFGWRVDSSDARLGWWYTFSTNSRQKSFIFSMHSVTMFLDAMGVNRPKWLVIRLVAPPSDDESNRPMHR
jgi:hypothetical protein